MARAILVSALLISVFGCANSSIPSDNASSENPGIEGDEQPGLPVAAFQDEQSGKYGYCDRRGRTVIEPQFDRADDFRDGMARVWLGHTISFIDPQGRTMFKLPPGTDRTRGGIEGVIWFQKSGDGRWGLCSTEGKIVVEQKYDDVREFSEGLAAVNVGAVYDRSHPPRLANGKWGFLNKKGEVVVPLTYEYADPFSDGLARVKEGKRYKFIDTAGKVVLEVPDFDYPHDYHEGLSAIQDYAAGVDNGCITRYIDKLGKLSFNVTGYAEDFHEGLAKLTLRPDPKSEFGKDGYIDKSGRVAIAATFDEVHDFSEGLAAVRLGSTVKWHDRGDTWGFIDRTGAMRIEAKYNEAGPFRNGVAQVHVGGDLVMHDFHHPAVWHGGEWWLIDTSGKRLRRLWIDPK